MRSNHRFSQRGVVGRQLFESAPKVGMIRVTFRPRSVLLRAARLPRPDDRLVAQQELHRIAGLELPEKLFNDGFLLSITGAVDR